MKIEDNKIRRLSRMNEDSRLKDNKSKKTINYLSKGLNEKV